MGGFSVAHFAQLDDRSDSNMWARSNHPGASHSGWSSPRSRKISKIPLTGHASLFLLCSSLVPLDMRQLKAVRMEGDRGYRGDYRRGWRNVGCGGRCWGGGDPEE